MLDNLLHIQTVAYLTTDMLDNPLRKRQLLTLKPNRHMHVLPTVEGQGAFKALPCDGAAVQKPSDTPAHTTRSSALSCLVHQQVSLL